MAVGVDLAGATLTAFFYEYLLYVTDDRAGPPRLPGRDNFFPPPRRYEDPIRTRTPRHPSPVGPSIWPDQFSAPSGHAARRQVR